jgi:hypothetical protein
MEEDNEPLENVIDEHITTVSYVANEEGGQELVSSTFWQPVNIVNHQAWQEIDRQIEASKRKIQAGRASCLHYYMTANQMDASLLAKYTDQSRWLVRLHLLPFFFKKLGVKTLKTYADFFKVTLDDLRQGNLKPPIYNDQEHEGQSVD